MAQSCCGRKHQPAWRATERGSEPAAVRARQNAKIAGLPADSRGAPTILLGLGETLWDVALRLSLPFGRPIEANPFPEELKLAFETPI